MEAQRHDPLCKRIVTWLHNPSGPEPVPGSREYVIEDGTLYHPRADTRSARIINRLVVPDCLRQRAIEAAHTAAHLGYEPTVLTLEQSVYWHGFRHDTKKYIATCIVCKEKLTNTPKPILSDMPLPPHPWHTVGMDLLQLPVTKHGHKYLLIVIDLLTRFATGMALKDKSSTQVAFGLKNTVFRQSLLGVPAIVVSDNGLEFANAVIAAAWNQAGFHHAI